MENYNQEFERLFNQQASIQKELYSLRIDTTEQINGLKIEVEKWKASVNVIRALSVVVFGIFAYFIQHQVQSYETWNQTQDTQQAELTKQYAAIENRVLKLEYKGIQHVNN